MRANFVAIGGWAFIPVEAEPAERLEDSGFGAFHKACLIGIFDSQQKLTTMMACDQPGKQRGSQITDVHIAGRTWSKTSTNSCHAVYYTLPWRYSYDS